MHAMPMNNTVTRTYTERASRRKEIEHHGGGSKVHGALRRPTVVSRVRDRQLIEPLASE
jgi:hypothetical protein